MGRVIWMTVRAPDRFYREHYSRTLVWVVAVAPLWIVGALANSQDRLWWWGAAVAIEVVGVWTAHPLPWRHIRSEHVDFDADHMMERCRLFLLIALGEGVMSTGAQISEKGMSLITVLTGTLAFGISVAIWSLVFGRSRRIVQHHVDDTTDPIRVTRYSVNSLLVMVAGLIPLAVAQELVIHEPFARGTVTLALLLAAGPILFLGAQAWYLWASPGVVPRLQLVGGLVCATAGVAGLALDRYLGLALMSCCLLTLAMFDRRMAVRARD
tara:strand:- start:1984 stop:2787 length:804 start_codon:yes stop_codon:yes gene_type:complete